jgi:hypothetical protein
MCRYVFDNLSCDQAEDLLWQHGEDGTYLVSHFHDPESYGMSIRVRYVSGCLYFYAYTPLSVRDLGKSN